MTVFEPCLLALLPSGSEWWIILIVVVVLFGGSRIPKLARGFGKGINEFKRGLKERPGEDPDELDDEESPKPPAPTTQTGP